MDYSSTCDEKIPQSKAMAAKGSITQAIDQLLALEKQTRTVSITLDADNLNLYLEHPFFIPGGTNLQ